MSCSGGTFDQTVAYDVLESKSSRRLWIQAKRFGNLRLQEAGGADGNWFANSIESITMGRPGFIELCRYCVFYN